MPNDKRSILYPSIFYHAFQTHPSKENTEILGKLVNCYKILKYCIIFSNIFFLQLKLSIDQKMKSNEESLMKKVSAVSGREPSAKGGKKGGKKK